MPIYSAACPTCGAEKDFFARIDDRDNTPVCCGASMSRQVTAPMAVQVPPDFGYRCQMSGETVTSYRRREYLMKKNNVVDAREYESFWKKSYQKRAEERAEVAKRMDAIPDQVKKAVQQTAPIAP